MPIEYDIVIVQWECIGRLRPWRLSFEAQPVLNFCCSALHGFSHGILVVPGVLRPRGFAENVDKFLQAILGPQKGGVLSCSRGRGSVEIRGSKSFSHPASCCGGGRPASGDQSSPSEIRPLRFRIAQPLRSCRAQSIPLIADRAHSGQRFLLRHRSSECG